MSKESDESLPPDSVSENLSLSSVADLLFIVKGNILHAWESQCREKVLAAKLQSHPALLNEIPKFIDQLILNIRPDFITDYEANSKVASDHGKERSDLNAYTLDQLIHEYQILRTTLIKFLEAEVPLSTKVSTLIHEFMDRGIRNAASRYAEVALKNEKNQRREIEHDRKELFEYFMQAPIAICVLEGPEHIFTLSNQHYDKLAGRKVLGQKVRDAFTEAEVGHFFEILDRVYLTGAPYVGKETSVPLLDLGGEVRERFIDFGYNPIRNSENKITAILAFHIDVTEQVLARKNLENSEARLLRSQELLEQMKQIAENERAKLSAVFAQTPGAIAVFEGSDHIFTMANPAYVSQFFGGRKDLIGKSVRAAVPEAVEQGFEKLLDHVYQTGEPYIGTETPIDLLQPDGKVRKFHINLVYQPLRDTAGKIIGIVAVIIDVTDQISARLKLEESEARLIKNQELLSTTVRVAKVGFFDWDVQKNSMTFSNQMRNDWGINSESSLQEVIARIHVDDREKTYQLIQKSISERTPFFAEYRVVRPDSRIIWIEAQGIVVYANDGTPICFYGTSIDITARKAIQFQLQFESHKLETIFKDSPAAMALWQGPGLIFEKVNPNYQSIFGNRELLGKSLLDAIPELEGQPFNDMLKKVFETGESVVGHEALAKIIRKKGGPIEDRYFDFTYVRVDDPSGKPYGVYDHAVDVTDRVVGRKQLQVAKGEAEKANQTKSSFLANMSHEIRTPLGSIIGFTDLLKDRELSYEERNQYLDTISRNGKALTKIIDDILDLAKVESGKLDVENLDFSLFDLIDDVLDVFRERTRSKNIFLRAHLNKEIPDRVFSDPTRIRQILINVVGNAVKFTASGGVTIEVSANGNASEKTQFKILVKDTGVGLTGEQKERLFQPFMQADNSTTRKYGGTGLGLALSKRLANALGGDIYVEVDEAARVGCTFGITFVAALPKLVATQVKIKDEAPKNNEANTQLLSGIRILLADDSPDNQVLVGLVLRRQGATVDIAVNGVEAFKMGMNGNFDLVLMDIQMPEMDGYEATRALREAGFKKPIVALTAHAMAEERARTLAAGCDGHLTKPLNQAELIDTIERLTIANRLKSAQRKDH